MLRTATMDSLVLIDELGRGTATDEGFGIAWAICQYLTTKIQCFCLFATHFHEMTSMSDELTNVKNVHVSAVPHEDHLQMLYKVKDGCVNQSYGIHVAQMLNFPDKVINNAKRLAN